MTVPVNIYIQNSAAVPLPVPGILVHVYDADGINLISGSETNADGCAGFLLEGSDAYGGTEYQLRFYKIGLRIDSPQQILVVEPAGSVTNDFDITCHDLREQPEAHDSRFCRLYTTLIDNAGQVVRGGRFSFRLTRNPVVLSGALMPVQDSEVYSDADGRVEIDLIRGGEYTVLLPGYEGGEVANIVVPDAPAWELTTVVFPYPLLLTFDPETPITVAVGAYTTIDLSLCLSDGRVFHDAGVLPWVDVYASDDCVGLQYRGGGKLRITGKSAGTCTLSARVRTSDVDARIPADTLTVTDVDITVT